MSEAYDNISDSLDIAFRYGQIDGAHHKMWVIDQMVRALCNTEDAYDDFVESYATPWFDEDGEEYFELWYTGIAP